MGTRHITAVVSEGTTNGYYPPKLVATYPLDELPTELQLLKLEKDCEQD